MGKRCVTVFCHGALNWQGALTFTTPLAVDRVCSCHLRPTTPVESGRGWPARPQAVPVPWGTPGNVHSFCFVVSFLGGEYPI